MSTDINTTGKTVLMRLPNFHTLDVRVEHRIARVTINNTRINPMDATMLGELDQLAGWLATQRDSVRVVIFQSAIRDFILAHLGLGLRRDDATSACPADGARRPHVRQGR